MRRVYFLLKIGYSFVLKVLQHQFSYYFEKKKWLDINRNNITLFQIALKKR